MKKQIWVLCALSLVTVVTPRGARAQLPDAVYSDVRDVIEELLSAEVAKTAVPQLACAAGRQRLPISDADQVDPRDCDKPDATSCPQRDVFQLTRLAASPTPPGQKPRAAVAEEQRFRLFALRFFPRTLQRVYTRQFGAIRHAILEESADLAGLSVYEALKAAQPTFIQAAALASHLDAPSFQLDDLPDFVAKIAGQEREMAGNAWFGELGDRSTQACVTAVGNRFSKGFFASKAVTPLDQACGSHHPPADEAFMCETAYAVRDSILARPQSAQDHLLSAIGWVVGEAVVLRVQTVANAAVAAGRTSKPEALTKLREIVLGSLRAQLTTSTAPAFATQVEAEVQRVVCGGSATAGLCEKGGLSGLLTEFNNTIGRLRVQWDLLSASGSHQVDVAAFVSMMTSADGALYELCSDSAQLANQAFSVCRAAESVLGQARPLWPIVSAAGSGDTREAVHLAIQALFHQGSSGAPDAESESKESLNDLYRRFAESVALYAIDAADGDVPTEGTRGAFKAAAVDLIQSISGPAGFQRAGWRPIVYPSFALRASWNPAYVNRDGGSFRYLASVNVLSGKFLLRYTNLTYVAFEGSLVDLVAPLSELALRDNQQEYDHKDRVTANLLSPRIDLLVGLPALSHHLVVGPGASLRMVAARRTSREVIDGVTFGHYDYQYLTFKEFGRYFEFGFFAKYLM